VLGKGGGWGDQGKITICMVETKLVKGGKNTPIPGGVKLIIAKVISVRREKEGQMGVGLKKNGNTALYG